MKKMLIFWVIAYSVSAQINKQDTTQPQIFLEGKLSTGLNERDLAISPDGNELLFTLVAPLNKFSAIFQMTKQSDGTWTKPKIASFSGNYPDLEPAFSPNGKKLYFVSKRPLNGESKDDFDIWMTEKVNGIWSEPKHLGNEVNTKMDEFYPSVAANGNLYFTASYNEPVSKEDIFLARFENGNYTKPVVLDSAVNSKLYEFNAYIAPDESYILFTAYGRKGDKGRGDIYMSIKRDGKWQIARPIESINSDKLDYCPTVSSDSKILFFTSERSQIKSDFGNKKSDYQYFENIQKSVQNGNGDIYWVDFEEILKAFNK
jgi:Tol biopolymer transport system component